MMQLQLLPALLWTVLCHHAWSYHIFTSPDQLDSTKTYDYIIVGGGTAGSVLAARLSEDERNQVLVIEAGGRVEDVLAIRIPFLGPTLPRSQVDWNYTTIPQTGLGNRIINIPRGFVLGGSSCINQMVFHRPSNGSWDHWADLVDDPSLSWEAVQKYWLRNSRLVDPVDGHDTSEEVILSAHGFGPVNVSVYSYTKPIHKSIIETSKKAVDEKFKFNHDQNAGSNLGWGWQQAAIGGGQRSCASTAYLSPLTNTRSNLDILINTQAAKLLPIPKTSNNLTPDLRIVEIAQNSTAPPICITARKEVILSAGFIGSPKILTLSGIGPEKELKRLGIPLLLESPDVGANLQDHILLPLYFTVVNGTDTNDELSRNATLRQEAIDQWIANRTGPMVNGQSNTVAYLRVGDDHFSSAGVKEDPSNGAGSAHIEILALDGFSRVSTIPAPPTGQFLTLIASLVAPLSSGNITFNSTDPFAYPLINPNFLTHKFDQAAIVQAMKDILEFVQLSPLNSLVTGIYGSIADAKTDAELLEYAREYSGSINHGSRTARMGPYGKKGKGWGVVDPSYRVKGVKGLRVVDASVFPQMPNVHTQASVYILAERAADIILGGQK
ncbi:GMC oxidoreductase [Periconia macrospinosa]|uniref:GMC oxidoreductase n=1 Tax=Periconia macrospinosa TaxID=97972 RepID=A0A2V1D1M2_9PLEO|nr:GMC oxidoreductase [Periconia macrospinosa]